MGDVFLVFEFRGEFIIVCFIKVLVKLFFWKGKEKSKYLLIYLKMIYLM